MTSQWLPSFLCNSANACPFRGGIPPLHGTHSCSASSLITLITFSMAGPRLSYIQTALKLRYEPFCLPSEVNHEQSGQAVRFDHPDHAENVGPGYHRSFESQQESLRSTCLASITRPFRRSLVASTCRVISLV